MASMDELRVRTLRALDAAIPRQRDAADRSRIAADDALIEAIRTGRPIGDDPIAQLLADWRAEVIEGT